MCKSKQHCELTLVDEAGVVINVTPDCHAWRCPECGPEKKCLHSQHILSKFSQLETVYYLYEPICKSRAVYYRGYRKKAEYVILTNDGMRFYFFDRYVKGTEALGLEQAKLMAEGIVHSITKNGRHVGYSRHWRMKRKVSSKKRRLLRAGLHRREFLEVADRFEATVTHHNDAAFASTLKDSSAFHAALISERNTREASSSFLIPPKCCAVAVQKEPADEYAGLLGEVIGRDGDYEDYFGMGDNGKIEIKRRLRL